MDRRPVDITTRPLFCDVANRAVVDFAARHGFEPHGEQAILRFRRERLSRLAPVTLPPLEPQWHEQFAALHDRTFPGTYAPSSTLLADRCGMPARPLAPVTY